MFQFETSDGTVTETERDKDAGEAKLEVMFTTTVGYETLATTSALYGTTKVNFDGIEGGGGCDTCGWGSSDSRVEISVKGVTKWPE